MSESDARWIFSTLKNHDIEVAEWKKRLETEVGLHNETILERNDFAGRYTTWRKIATYGVPSGIFAGLIFGLLLGG